MDEFAGESDGDAGAISPPDVPALETGSVPAPTEIEPATDVSTEVPAATDSATAPDGTSSSTTVAADPSTSLASGTAPVPAVDAAAFAVYDLTADRWMADSQADTPRAVGSLMKLLTAHVVMEAGDLTKVVTVPPMTVDPAESAIGLYQGEQLERATLLRAMLIVSANDAARSLAIDNAGTEPAFVEKMNAAARQLGLTNTVAGNATGLDAPGAQSTAREMIQLGSRLMADPDFRTTVARTEARLHGQTFPNTNDLLTTYIGADGIKTGSTTQAGYCVLASATRDGRTIVVAVLGASTDAARFESAIALLDWAFAN